MSMMKELEEQGIAAERQFANSEELHFKIMARRNKLLGRWAAKLLGHSGEEKERFVRRLIRTGLSGKGFVQAKLRADLAEVGQDAGMIGHQVVRCLVRAEEEILAEFQSGEIRLERNNVA